VALVTGWGDQIDPAEARQRGIDHVLAKPFELSAVTRLLCDVLGDQAPPP
jgi:hypothetical protein